MALMAKPWGEAHTSSAAAAPVVRRDGARPDIPSDTDHITQMIGNVMVDDSHLARSRRVYDIGALLDDRLHGAIKAAWQDPGTGGFEQLTPASCLLPLYLIMEHATEQMQGAFRLLQQHLADGRVSIRDVLEFIHLVLTTFNNLRISMHDLLDRHLKVIFSDSTAAMWRLTGEQLNEQKTRFITLYQQELQSYLVQFARVTGELVMPLYSILRWLMDRAIARLASGESVPQGVLPLLQRITPALQGITHDGAIINVRSADVVACRDLIPQPNIQGADETIGFLTTHSYGDAIQKVLRGYAERYATIIRETRSAANVARHAYDVSSEAMRDSSEQLTGARGQIMQGEQQLAAARSEIETSHRLVAERNETIARMQSALAQATANEQQAVARVFDLERQAAMAQEVRDRLYARGRVVFTLLMQYGGEAARAEEQARADILAERPVPPEEIGQGDRVLYTPVEMARLAEIQNLDPHSGWDTVVENINDEAAYAATRIALTAERLALDASIPPSPGRRPTQLQVDMMQHTLTSAHAAHVELADIKGKLLDVTKDRNELLAAISAQRRVVSEDTRSVETLRRQLESARAENDTISRALAESQIKHVAADKALHTVADAVIQANGATLPQHIVAAVRAGDPNAIANVMDGQRIAVAEQLSQVVTHADNAHRQSTAAMQQLQLELDSLRTQLATALAQRDALEQKRDASPSPASVDTEPHLFGAHLQRMSAQRDEARAQFSTRAQEYRNVLRANEELQRRVNASNEEMQQLATELQSTRDRLSEVMLDRQHAAALQRAAHATVQDVAASPPDNVVIGASLPAPLLTRNLRRAHRSLAQFLLLHYPVVHRISPSTNEFTEFSNEVAGPWLRV